VTPALLLESAESRTNPAIEDVKKSSNLGNPNVVGPSSKDRIKVSEDGLDVSPLLTPSQLSDAVFESFEGFGADAQTEVVKSKPEKIKTLTEIRKTSLRLMERELEFPEHHLHIIESTFRLLAAFAENNEVVRVSHMAPAFGLDGFVQVIEYKVGKPRRDDTPLWSPLRGNGDDIVFADTSFEKVLDQIQNSPVGDTSANAGHHHRMVDFIEEGSDISVNNFAISFLGILDHGGDGSVGTAVFSEAEAAWRHLRVKQRFNDLNNRLLNDAVGHNGNSERTKF